MLAAIAKGHKKRRDPMADLLAKPWLLASKRNLHKISMKHSNISSPVGGNGRGGFGCSKTKVSMAKPLCSRKRPEPGRCRMLRAWCDSHRDHRKSLGGTGIESQTVVASSTPR